jgi:CRP/FNR family transcriptional regulator, anaerobic regulatory protein
MRQQVIHFLDSIHPLGEALKDRLLRSLKEAKLKKKEVYLQAGQTSQRISFVVQGLMRSYYLNKKGEEVTNWFMQEGDLAMSIRSFFQQVPSQEYLVAVEPTVLLYITHNELQDLYHTYPEFNFVGRKLTERYYTFFEERLMGIRSLTAAERYAFLLREHPEIVERCPDIYIASYLDMDKATLARLKARR